MLTILRILGKPKDPWKFLFFGEFHSVRVLICLMPCSTFSFIAWNDTWNMSFILCKCLCGLIWNNNWKEFSSVVAIREKNFTQIENSNWPYFPHLKVKFTFTLFNLNSTLQRRLKTTNSQFCLHFPIKRDFSLLLMGPNNTELQLVPQTLFLQHFLYGGRHVLTNQHSVSFLNVICPTGLHGGLLLVNIIRDWTQYVRWKDRCFKYWLFWWTLFWTHLQRSLHCSNIIFARSSWTSHAQDRIVKIDLLKEGIYFSKTSEVVTKELVSEKFSGQMLTSMKSHCKYSDLNFPTQNLWGHNFEANWGERCVNLRFICTS